MLAKSEASRHAPSGLAQVTEISGPTTSAPPSRSDTAMAHRRASAAIVPSVTRAMALLDLLARERIPMTLGRLAGKLELPKSSVHALCHTLLSLGYLRRQGDAAFYLGPAVMPLANSFVSGTDVTQAFNAVWDDMGEPPEETMILSVLNGHEVVYLAARIGSRALGLAFRVGMRLPASLAASGRAMLAFLPADEVRSIYSKLGPAAPTKGQAPTLDQLADELATIRTLGYSFDDEGVRGGVFCIGAPVFDDSSAVVAGVGICLQKAALDERNLAKNRETVLHIAQLLSQRLGGKLPEPARPGGEPSPLTSPRR